MGQYSLSGLGEGWSEDNEQKKWGSKQEGAKEGTRVDKMRQSIAGKNKDEERVSC